MKRILLLAALMTSTQAWSYGNGFTTAPMISKKKMVSTELTGITSTGGGLGLQARYTQKVNADLTFDAGIGMGGGELNNRVFVGADYLIFPDYQRQPRVSVKTTFENAKEFGDRRNIVSLAPTVSKGFSFWGNEAFPYLSMPVALNLNTGSKTYETGIAAQLGATGQLPLEGYRHLTVAVEGTIKIKDHHSGLAFSVGYPLD